MEGTINIESHFQEEFQLLNQLQTHPNIVFPFHTFVDTFDASQLRDWTAEKDTVRSRTLFVVTELLPTALHVVIRDRSRAVGGCGVGEDVAGVGAAAGAVGAAAGGAAPSSPAQQPPAAPLFSRAEILTVTTGLVDALVYMHEKFIVHRDFKAGE